MAKNYEQMAKDILGQIGGKENVTFVSHCMTRLRLNVNDEAAINVDGVKSVAGVLGCQFNGGQFQIIIGQDVPKAYDAFCKLGNFAVQKAAVEENLDAPKQKLTVKSAFNGVMGAITGCLTPLIPILMIAGMVKMLVALLGPTMLGVISETNDLYIVLNLLGDACFYFFPVMVGVSASKKFDCSPMLAVLMGGVLLSPTLIEIVNAGEAFTVYGIPMRLTSYASTVIPMILICWVMSYVEKFLKKHIPDVLSTICVPLFTALIMLPLTLCVLGPLGAILGDYVCAILFGIHDVFGPLGVAVIAALFPPLVVTGMHVPLNAACLLSFAQLGYDATVYPGSMMTVYASMAVSLAFLIRAKNAEDRSLGISCFVAQALGGVGEPQLYGIALRFKSAFISLLSGSFCGGLVCGILNCKVYFPTASNFLAVLAYGSGDVGEIIRGCIGAGTSFVVTFVLMMLLGYRDDHKKVKV